METAAGGKSRAKCRMCQKRLSSQIVCKTCFSEMGVQPFREFKLLYTSNLERSQNAIAAYQPSAKLIGRVRIVRQREIRYRTLAAKRQLEKELIQAIRGQQEQIKSRESIVNSKFIVKTALADASKAIEDEIRKKESTAQSILREKQEIKKKLQQLRIHTFHNVYKLTDLSLFERHPPQLAISRITLPVLQDDCESTVSYDTLLFPNKIQDQVWVSRTVFWLERISTRLLLLSKTLRIDFPYPIRIKNVQEIYVSGRRLLVYVQGKIAELPRMMRLLLSCSRKRKSSLYIDEEALGCLQVNCDYLMSKAGYNFQTDKDRLLVTDQTILSSLVEEPRGFVEWKKMWESCLPSSMIKSVEEERLELMNSPHQLQEQQTEREFVVIDERHDFVSIHSSSEDLDFEDASPLPD